MPNPTDYKFGDLILVPSREMLMSLSTASAPLPEVVRVPLDDERREIQAS